MPAPVWNSAARLGLRYAPVVAQLEELQRKLRSSALPAALRIERGSNRIENPYMISRRGLTAEDAALCCAARCAASKFCCAIREALVCTVDLIWPV